MPETKNKVTGQAVEGEGDLREPLLMWQFLRAFIWLDRGLQENIGELGWPSLSRTESQVMLLTSVGIGRPIEIARNLGLSRQAVYQSISQLEAKGLIVLRVDHRDKRRKILTFSRDGEAMRHDAIMILRSLEEELARRGGLKEVTGFRSMDDWDWSVPPVYED
jgi:DNA-binding MarR family transcriptional regulator